MIWLILEKGHSDQSGERKGRGFAVLTNKPKLANIDKTFEDISKSLETTKAIICLDVNSEEFVWENAV